MAKKNKYLLLTFILLLAQIYTQSTGDVVISRISNDPVEGQGNRYSSMVGGTVFYLRGTGFDVMINNNVVLVGSEQAVVTGKGFFIFIYKIAFRS